MTLVVLGVLVAILVVAGDRTRRTAMLSEDLSNMRQIATLTGQYAADNQDLFWTFSWQGGETYGSKWPELNTAASDVEAAANQAVVILRDAAGREDMPKIVGWFSYVMYSHLPLLQYAALEFPNRLFVSSGDWKRQLWASDPAGFDLGKFLPNQPPPSDPNSKRWPYSSSYQMASSFFDRAEDPSLRTWQTEYEAAYITPLGHDYSPKRMSSTAFPSQKVHLHDKYAWHFGAKPPVKPFKNLVYPYFAEADARLPLLFVDGHASVHRSGDGNPGWQPNKPALCPPTLLESPSSGNLVPGRYRWTRSYLNGRDVGGPEVDGCLD